MAATTPVFLPENLMDWEAWDLKELDIAWATNTFYFFSSIVRDYYA